jgi:hypothetical protein
MRMLVVGGGGKTKPILDGAMGISGMAVVIVIMIG